MSVPAFNAQLRALVALSSQVQTAYVVAHDLGLVDVANVLHLAGTKIATALADHVKLHADATTVPA